MESNLDSRYRVLGSAPLSLALGQRYPWLDQVWYGAWMLFLLVGSAYAVIQIFRQRDGHVGYRGVPGWVVTLLGDEVDPRARPRTGQSSFLPQA